MKIFHIETFQQWPESHGYYLNLADALNDMKKFIAEYKKELRRNKTLAKKEDIEDSESNGEIKMKESNPHGILYEASVFGWYRCSYEYDEWDVGGRTYRIIEIVVKS